MSNPENQKEIERALKKALKHISHPHNQFLLPHFPALHKQNTPKEILTQALAYLAEPEPVCTTVLTERFIIGKQIATVSSDSLEKTGQFLTFDMVSDYQKKGLQIIIDELLRQEVESRPSSLPTLLKTLPDKTYTHLFGVDTLITQSTQHLSDVSADPILLIHGIGGIGKTAAARQIAEIALSSGQYTHTAWHTFNANAMDAASSKTPSDPFRQLISKLSKETSIQAQDHPEKVQVEKIKNALQQSPYLIVLDNLEQSDTTLQTLALVQQIVKPPSKLLITSRACPPERPAGYAIKIPLLSTKASLALIRDLAKKRNFEALQKVSKSDLLSLIDLVGGNPLALKISASLVDQLGFVELKRALKGGFSPQIDKELYEHVYRPAWEALDSTSEAVLHATLLTAVSGNPTSYLETISGIAPEPFHRSLALLNNRSLIDLHGTSFRTEKTVSIHPLTRQFLHSSFVQTKSFVGQIQRAIGFWQAKLKWGDDAAISAIDAHKSTIWQTVACGRRSPETFLETAGFVADTYQLVERRNYWAEWIPVIESFTDQLDPDQPLYQRLENQRGSLYRLLLHIDEAAAIHTTVRTLARKSNNIVEEIESELHLAFCAYRSSDLDRVIRHGTNAESLLRSLNPDSTPDSTKKGATHSVSPRKWGAISNVLGLAYQEKGDPDKALIYFENAIEVYRREKDDTYLATVQMNLARCLTDLNRLDEATATATEALDTAEQAKNIFQQAHSRVIRAIAFAKANHYDEALDDLYIANNDQIKESSNEWLKGTIKSCLGNCYLEMGDATISIPWLEEAIDHLSNTEDPPWTANAYFSLAKAQEKIGEPTSGIQSAQQALLILTDYAHIQQWASTIKKLNQLILTCQNHA